MSFQERLSAHGRATGGRLVSLWGHVDAGDLAHGEFVDVAALTLGRANAQSVALAELSLNAQLTAAGHPTVAGADLADVDHWLADGRLRKAVQTSVEVPDTAVGRLDRLGRSEAVSAGQQAHGDAMRASPFVEGWVRDPEGKACEMCSDWWYRDGRVWPKEHPMPKHTGCECAQKPVMAESIELTEKLKKAERARRAMENTDRRSSLVREALRQQEAQQTT